MGKASAIARGSLDPELDQAFAQGLCGQTLQARAAAQRVMACCFAARLGADGSAAWRGSSLTGDGFPLEFAVSAQDPQLRFSCEPGARSLAPATRMALASTLAARLGGAKLPAGMLAALRWAQRGANLRYGGWLGARVSDQGAVATKLYAELAADRPPPLLGEWMPDLPGRQIQPRMFGIDASGRGELYLRIESLQPAEVIAVLAPAGMAERADEILAVLSESYGHTLRGRMPGSSVGVSYSPGETGCTVTLYFFARSLWGGDARIRQKFAALISHEQQRAAYTSATAPLANRDQWATRHGLAGLVLRPGLPPSWVIGFRPQVAA